jgi:aminodeoxyfutalosine deaminase
MNSLEAFVSALPKVELHVHLVGSASVETVLTLARRHPEAGVPATADGLREFYRFSDFPHFIDVYQAVSGLVSEPEDIADLVRGIARDLAAQNVRYVELQAAPYPFQGRGMPDAVISEALSAGARDALTEHGVRIGYIVDFPGHAADQDARPALRFALDNPPAGLVGFGIGGIEAGRAPYAGVIRDVFGAAHAAGLRCVPHAGETTGAETVWEAVNFLHAERIGHGIRSLEDPALVDYLSERRLPVDVSPTSNVCTRCVPSIGEHPLRDMIEAGLFVTLNSDDPPMFGTSLSNEYLVAGRDLGLSPAELAGLAANGVRASFLAEAEKEALLAEIAAVPLCLSWHCRELEGDAAGVVNGAPGDDQCGQRREAAVGNDPELVTRRYLDAAHGEQEERDDVTARRVRPQHLGPPV